AVSDRIALGSHFAQPTPDSIAVAEELKRRFGLPKWRFGNSGTEATMDAVHLMRVATGRWKMIKVEGSYHGHHDSVQVSVYNEVKTGRTMAPGGATEYFGVRPDIVCLAKALGGGLPCGAVGGSEEVMSLIAEGEYEQVGTFNGNPLTMAAARATVTEILNDD